MRPKTIVFFEWIIFGALLVDLLRSYLHWDQVIARVIAENAPLDHNTAVAITLTTMIFSFVLVGTLTLLVSRRRSKITMWVLIALSVVVLSLTVLAIIQARRLLASEIIWAALESIAQVVACVLLFTPSRDAGCYERTSCLTSFIDTQKGQEETW